jgi:hypothetical protein
LYFDLAEQGASDQDVVDVMEGSWRDFGLTPLSKQFLRFPVSRFPPTEEGRNALMKELQEAATNQGFSLNMRNVNSFDDDKKAPRFSLACARGFTYRMHSDDVKRVREGHKSGKVGTMSSTLEGASYEEGIRTTHMQNTSRLGSRGSGGKHMPRKTSTRKPLRKEDKCTFILHVFILKKECWVMKAGSGCGEHLGHENLSTSRIPVRTSQLKAAQQELIDELMRHSYGSGSLQSLFLEKHNILLSRQQCYLIHSKRTGSKEETSLTPAEGLLNEFCKQPQTSFVAIFSEAINTALVGERGKGRPKRSNIGFQLTAAIQRPNGSHHPLPIEDVPADTVHAKLLPLRERLKVGDKILIAAFWVRDSERRLFELFPEVLFCDVTSQTNQEGRPYFMMCGRDSNGKSFTAMRAYLPNEQRWVFQYIWSTCAKHLLGDRNCKNNCVMISDGDVNISAPYLQAKKEHVFENGSHRTCLFHLVNLGMRKIQLLGRDQPIQKYIFITTQKWILSWMRSGGVESEEEFKLSRAELVKWLQQVSNQGGSTTQTNVRLLVEFIRVHIVPHKLKWFNPYHMATRGFDETTSSLVESLNAAMKTRGNAVAPNMSLPTSARTIENQAMVADALRDMEATLATESTPLWANTKTSRFVTEFAEGLISTEVAQAKYYAVYCDQPNSLYLVRRFPSTNKSDSPIFHFDRVRSIHIVFTAENRKYCTCSCKYFDRRGLPCRHMIALFGEPEVQNVSIRWLRDYLAKHLRPGFEAATEHFKKALMTSLLGCELTDEQLASLQRSPLSTAGCCSVDGVEPKYFLDKTFCSESGGGAEDKENNVPSYDELDFTMSQEQFLTENVIAWNQAEANQDENPYIILYPTFKEITTRLVGCRDRNKIQVVASQLESILVNLNQGLAEHDPNRQPDFLGDSNKRIVSSECHLRDQSRKAKRKKAYYEN